MSHSYFPNDQEAADTSLLDKEVDADEEFPIHSGDEPHHHHHHHKKHEHHEHHHKHEHNDATHLHDNSVNDRSVHNNLGNPKAFGTVAFAVQQIIAVIKALPDKKSKQLALGHACARLIEQDHIDGYSNIIEELKNTVNRYAHVD